MLSANPPRWYAAKFEFLDRNLLGNRKVRSQEALVPLPHSIVPACNVFRRERILPHREGALALRPLELLAFAGRRQALHLTRRLRYGFQDIVSPDKVPSRLRHGIDVLHTLPAPIARADAVGLRFMG